MLQPSALPPIYSNACIAITYAYLNQSDTHHPYSGTAQSSSLSSPQVEQYRMMWAPLSRVDLPVPLTIDCIQQKEHRIWRSAKNDDSASKEQG
mmetsp:Transcript_6703/g.16270  ORF Transcript_6703/g.16270 Transcript_6703/m.16270 type:complete len:93 (-) Transcript_6703:1796-2074(-)